MSKMVGKATPSTQNKVIKELNTLLNDKISVSPRDKKKETKPPYWFDIRQNKFCKVAILVNLEN
jgi:hypothetical protein